VPALVIQSTADRGVFPSHAHTLFDALGATDKKLEFIPGEHYFEGDGSDRERLADLIADWTAERGG
jgi:fermentation-respiration switch protein FrsA (DUF1100 family)